ncbi:CPBP family intramembrane glutamic endopeptidase [Shimia sp. SDUM112013]|uniref:CPBP family intramembrane glutamic endopeptidase n=1 Tax=Shimia sp. SDUM112013 TaxID=3136160 RepID=UPI0032EBD4AA
MAGYRLHEVLLAPARPTAQPARLVGGVILTVAGFMAMNVMFYQILQQTPLWDELRPAFSDGTDYRAIWIMLGNFALLLSALGIAMQMVHNRPLLALLGPRKLFLFDARRVLRRVMPLFLLVFLIPSPAGLAPDWNMALAQWLILVPFTLPLILLQVGTEELLFRGYLQTHLAARFRSPLVWMVLPSGLFAYLHYDPETFGPNAVAMAGLTGLFALAAADLTARAGNLGPAVALHFVNNVFAILITGMDGYWDGLALFTLPFDPSDVETVRQGLMLEALVILCGWLAARIAIRR